jgi:hypothetical protein
MLGISKGENKISPRILRPATSNALSKAIAGIKCKSTWLWLKRFRYGEIVPSRSPFPQPCEKRYEIGS